MNKNDLFMVMLGATQMAQSSYGREAGVYDKAQNKVVPAFKPKVTKLSKSKRSKRTSAKKARRANR